MTMESTLYCEIPIDVYVCTYIGVCINVSIWRPEVNIGCPSQLLSTLFLETGSHIEVAAQ